MQMLSDPYLTQMSDINVSILSPWIAIILKSCVSCCNCSTVQVIHFRVLRVAWKIETLCSRIKRCDMVHNWLTWCERPASWGGAWRRTWIGKNYSLPGAWTESLFLCALISKWWPHEKLWQYEKVEVRQEYVNKGELELNENLGLVAFLREAVFVMLISPGWE